MENVHILPGSPKYFKPAVDEIVSYFEGGVPFYIDELDLSCGELKIVKKLDSFAERWKGRVNVGSYPQHSASKILTKITFEGCKEDVLAAKEEFRMSSLAHRFSDNGFDKCYAQEIMAKAQEQPHVKQAWDILEECYNR